VNSSVDGPLFQNLNDRNGFGFADSVFYFRRRIADTLPYSAMSFLLFLVLQHSP
jgi:hypothetical protein